MKLEAIKFVVYKSVGCYVGGELNFIAVSHDWKHWIHKKICFNADLTEIMNIGSQNVNII